MVRLYQAFLQPMITPPQPPTPGQPAPTEKPIVIGDGPVSAWLCMGLHGTGVSRRPSEWHCPSLQHGPALTTCLTFNIVYNSLIFY
jgi:hypothetical protein